MAIKMDEYEKIRYMKEVERVSQREAAKRLGLSRNTVRRYWNGETVPWERRCGSGRKNDVVTEEVKAFIRSCIKEDEESGLKKQHHTARRIFTRLVDELGFEGGESTIRRAVAEQKQVPRDAFVPLEYSPGEAIQVDWGEARIFLGGKKLTINMWCMRECYSGEFFCRAYYRQNEESFLEGMREGIEHFGGAPHKMIFDNARVAVKEGFGAYAKATDKYSAMAAHYAFRPVFCNVASGHEKGLVEGLVGFVRRNTLVPVPQVDSLDELNRLFDDKARAYLEHVIDGKKESVGVRGEAARAGLIALPPYRFDTTKTSVVKADDFSLVRFDSNRYSVPVRYAGREVTVKGSVNSVSIIFRGEDIAVWERDYSRGAVHYRLEQWYFLHACFSCHAFEQFRVIRLEQFWVKVG